MDHYRRQSIISCLYQAEKCIFLYVRDFQLKSVWPKSALQCTRNSVDYLLCKYPQEDILQTYYHKMRNTIQGH